MRSANLLGVEVNLVTLAEAVDLVDQWCFDTSWPSPCRYVVTPNLDHAVFLKQRPELRALYQEAALVIADGMPMVWASRLGRHDLKERVAGSDLVPGLLARKRDGQLRVYLLGAAPGVAERAAAEMQSRFEKVTIVGTYSPDLGFERSERECERIVQAINETEPHLLVVGLGAPKQELWVHKYAGSLRCGVAICAGATIDFIAGHRQRAPRWMQLAGAEWLYRALSEPRRLLPRYAKDALYLPILLHEDWKQRRSLGSRG